MRLSGPALDSKEGTAFERCGWRARGSVVVEGHTGMILEILRYGGCEMTISRSRVSRRRFLAGTGALAATVATTPGMGGCARC